MDVWTGPFNGRLNRPGSARQLGRVGWLWEPIGGILTVHRVMVTVAGQAAGDSIEDILARVLQLAERPTDPGAIPRPRREVDRALSLDRW